MGKKITAIIPAFNEEGTIASVIRGLKKYATDIVVVDDASKDRTGEIAKKEGAIVVTHTKNQGYDRSIDDGFKKAAENEADIVFTFDADGQHDPNDLPIFIEPIMKGEVDVVVGRRPYHARITEYLYAFVSQVKAGVSDPMCGLKSYNIAVYKDVGYFDRVTSIGAELVFQAKKRGYKIIERDIRLNSRADSSRFGVRLKGNYKIFTAILRVLFI